MKNIIKNVTIALFITSQIACGLGDSCPSATYTGVDQESGASVEDKIVMGGSASDNSCHSFTDNVTITSPEGEVYSAYSECFAQDNLEEIIALLFPDLVFDSNSQYRVCYSTNSNDFGSSKTLTFTIHEDTTLLDTKNIEIKKQS